MAQKVQRGAIVRKNDNGTLEWVDNSRTYIGTATLPNGKVITKRFRRNGFDEDEVAERWLKWQCKNVDEDEVIEEEEADMAEKNTGNNKAKKCPFNGGCDCTPSCALFSDANFVCSLKLGALGMFNVTGNYLKMDPNESLELIAMAIGELKPASKPAEKEPEPTVAHVPTEADGIAAYLEGKTFLSFVNMHSNPVYAKYKKFCQDGGFPCASKKDIVKAIDDRFPELNAIGKKGGAVFEAA